MNYTIIINRDNPINLDYLEKVIIPSLTEVNFERNNDDVFKTYGITEKKIYLEKETAIYFEKLKKFLRMKGIVFDICSGYLSLEQQEKKYTDFLNRNGTEMTQHRMCHAGYSEHHSGLAIDCDFYKNGDWAGIVPDNCGNEQEETKYIHSIISDFGFILRYPKDKTEVTKMQYEPWHIRYVGTQLAKELCQHNITLEEYHKKINQISKIR